MKRCGARPYRGKEKYIFISYSHKDIPLVFPVIERFTRDGYRVWYDEGIDPGSEWPTTIAEHLLNCEVCIPLISGNFLNSSNCRQEITYALSKNKKVMTVMLEDVTLPAGLDMQLSVIHKVYKQTQTEDEFFNNLYEAPFLEPCKGKPNPAIRVSAPEDHEEKKSKVFPEKQAQDVNRTADSNGKEPENVGRTADSNGKESENVGRTADPNGKEPENVGRTADPNGKEPENVGRTADSNGKEPGNEARTAGSGERKTGRGASKAGDSKKSAARGWRKYLPPGYRTGKIWHMLIATYYYVAILLGLIVSTGTDVLDNIILWGFGIVLFYGSAAIWGNYLDCWQKLPLMKNKLGRILGFVLYPTLLFTIMCVLSLIVMAFTGEY